jgi:hypothetical protein
MRANDIQAVPRAVAPLAALALVCCIATACTGPARTTSTYQSKAADTAEEVVSASRTVLLAAQIGDAGRSFPQTIAVTIANAETDAETARDAFSSIQPPDATSDEIRATLLPSVERVCNVIAEVRIAARRADVGSLSQIAAPLEQLADDLEGFSERYG